MDIGTQLHTALRVCSYVCREKHHHMKKGWISMKKKIALFLLCTLMLLSLCACGQSEEAAVPAPTKAPEIKSAAPTKKPEPEPEPEPEGTPLSSAFWSLRYPEGWAVHEDGVKEDERYASVTVGIPDESSDGFDASVYVSVTLDDPGDFRDAIKDAGMDLYDVIENGNASHSTVGGVDCIDYASSYWGDDAHFYRARVENAGANVVVRAIGDAADEGIQAVLSSLAFTLEDTGNIDPPYPWNGTPFTTEPASKMVGTYTLSAEQLPFAQSLVVDDIFSGRIGQVGNQLYVLLDEKLSVYSMENGSLTHVSDIALEDRYEEMSVCEGGVIYISQFGSPLLAIKDGAIIASYEGPDSVAMHPSGDWGISYFTNNEVEKLSFKDGVMSVEPIVLEDLKSVRSITICDDRVLIAGSVGDDNDHALLVYDTKLKLKLTMRDQDADPSGPKYLGSITHAFTTDNGIIALDGNMRDIYLWTDKGAFIGGAEVPELFGASYAWLSAAHMQEDGTILVGMNQERDDRSADEFILFRMTGF